MSGDIRKWFVKPHDTGTVNSLKPNVPVERLSETANKPDNRDVQGQGSLGRRKTSKYFSTDNQDPDLRKDTVSVTKRKAISNIKGLANNVKSSPVKEPHKMDVDDDDAEDFVKPVSRENNYSGRRIINKEAIDHGSDEEDPDVKISKNINFTVTPNKKLKRNSGIGISKNNDIDVISGVDSDDKTTGLPVKSAGRGRGGRGTPTAVRGSGGGRGGFMNFGERKDPPHKGEKDTPEGAPNCLAGLTFVISGTLDSLEREEAEDLIKRHGGRVTGSVSKKTSYLLCDEDIEGRKSAKAKELGTSFLTEDGLFDMIRSFTFVNAPKKDSEIIMDKSATLPNKTPNKIQTVQSRDDRLCSSLGKGVASKGVPTSCSFTKHKDKNNAHLVLTWTEKYKPRVPNDIIGNQALVNQLRDWLMNWNDHFLHSDMKGKGKKQNDSIAKKAVLLSGTPGIGKTTSAKLVSLMLGFQIIEVNASDSRGKADLKIQKGVDGKATNSFKELVSNEVLGVNMECSKHTKTVLIMDEVDGMSAGDRGGVADLIASIKISKIPIVCICNDRYSQKLKSLVNYCLLLSFRKPTKQQMAKRLLQIANAEGLQVNEIALEELAERSNGDMRIAVNQLQYMGLSLSVINYDDIRQRLLTSAKDEDISPFTAVDRLFGFNGGRLRMDERIDLSMSDSDLVPLLIQENYMNYRPNSVGRDENGLKRMSLIAHAAKSIAEGDIINKQIRRFGQWQLSQIGSLVSCIIPAAFLHGQREILQQGERNFNRFGGWLGKNSTMGKNFRLLEDLHFHFLASRKSNLWREALRVDYFTLVLKQLTDPLRTLPKDDAVDNVMEFMDMYSITQEDFDTIVELSKYQMQPNPLNGILPAVKSALTKAYNQRSSSRVIRAADLITIPGMKKARKKPNVTSENDLALENDDDTMIVEGEEEENPSETEEPEDDSSNVSKLQSQLQNRNSRGIKVEVEFKGGKGAEHSSAKKTPRSRAPPAKRKR